MLRASGILFLGIPASLYSSRGPTVPSPQPPPSLPEGFSSRNVDSQRQARHNFVWLPRHPEGLKTVGHPGRSGQSSRLELGPLLFSGQCRHLSQEGGSAWLEQIWCPQGP